MSSYYFITQEKKYRDDKINDKAKRLNHFTNRLNDHIQNFNQKNDNIYDSNAIFLDSRLDKFTKANKMKNFGKFFQHKERYFQRADVLSNYISTYNINTDKSILKKALRLFLEKINEDAMEFNEPIAKHIMDKVNYSALLDLEENPNKIENDAVHPVEIPKIDDIDFSDEAQFANYFFSLLRVNHYFMKKRDKHSRAENWGTFLEALLTEENNKELFEIAQDHIDLPSTQAFKKGKYLKTHGTHNYFTALKSLRCYLGSEPVLIDTDNYKKSLGDYIQFIKAEAEDFDAKPAQLLWTHFQQTGLGNAISTAAAGLDKNEK